ncbi:MAG: arginase family protein [Deltaproteobacteria bacterium]|nr:arginase family protein [Deltaproteobacteria bacterium]
MALAPVEELALLLKPAAGGLYLVSTGRAEQLAVQRSLYGVDDDARIVQMFRESLDRIAAARVVILGVPSDVGAGFRRGSNLAPQAIRATMLSEDPDYRAYMDRERIVDIGDVFVVPQLLHDEMLAPAQLEASRRALYPDVAPEVRATLPVSPLSIAERALDLVFAINPRVKPFVLGGDHSNAWPVAAALSRARRDWGIVQPDAHTDLLAERLGIRYCFATWSYHANDLIGRGGRMVQVGTRASRRDRAHWESTLGVRQFWGEECRARPEQSLDAILAHVKSVGVSSVYFSNDIDGTDAAWADATGTPEPGGLEPDFVVELIRRLGREVGLCAGDLMEVAPPLESSPGSAARTLSLAARYGRETLAALTSEPALAREV